MTDTASVTAPIIPLRDLPTYTGSYDDSVRLLVTVDNINTSMMPYSVMAGAFVARAAVPAGIGTAGAEGQLAIAPTAVYTYTNGGWGASPRYRANWDDITETTRFLLVDRATQNLTAQEKANGRANLGIGVASASEVGLAKAGSGIEVAEDGTFSVSAATPSRQGIVYIDASDEDKLASSAVSKSVLDAELASLRDYVNSRTIPIAAADRIGGIVPSNTVLVDSVTGVATVPEATVLQFGLVRLSEGSRGDNIGVVTGAQAESLATSVVRDFVHEATTTSAGLVRVGDGLSVTSEGLLSVKKASPRASVTATDGLYGTVLPTMDIAGDVDANSDTMVPTVNAVRNYVHDQLTMDGAVVIHPGMLPIAGGTAEERGAVYASSTVEVSASGQLSVHIASGSEYPLRPGLLKATSSPGQVGADATATAITPAYLTEWRTVAMADAGTAGFVKTVTASADDTAEKRGTVPTVNKVVSMMSSLQTSVSDVQTQVNELVVLSQTTPIVPVMSANRRGVAQLWTYGSLPDDDSVERIPLTVTSGMLYILKSDLPASSSSGSSSSSSSAFDHFQEVVTGSDAYLTVETGTELVIGNSPSYYSSPENIVTKDSSGVRHYDGVVLDNKRLALGLVSYTDQQGNANYAEVVVGDDSVEGLTDTEVPFVVRSPLRTSSEDIVHKIQTTILPNEVSVATGRGDADAGATLHVDDLGAPDVSLKGTDGDSAVITTSTLTVTDTGSNTFRYLFPADQGALIDGANDLISDYPGLVVTASVLESLASQYFVSKTANEVRVESEGSYVFMNASAAMSNGPTPMVRLSILGGSSLGIFPTGVRAGNGDTYCNYVFWHDKEAILNATVNSTEYANCVVTMDVLQMFLQAYTNGNSPSTGLKLTLAATSVGLNAYATGSYSTALGTYARALATASTAVGYGAYASSDNATALGKGSSAAGAKATSVGVGTYADTSATAVGYGASAFSSEATAIGMSANASEAGTTAIGKGANAVYDYSTAIGCGVSAIMENSVAMRAGSDMALSFWVDSNGHVWLGKSTISGVKKQKIDLTDALSTKWQSWS